MGATLAMMKEHASIWPPDALVTDLVSLKAPLAQRAAELGVAGRFVGAHPICGGASSGFDSGRADLFQGAVVWLCAAEQASETLRKRAESFWSAIGGIPRWSGAEEHDAQMAWVSHLPQLVANALAGALDSAGYSPSDLGPGGRDMTRLAGSNPNLWKDLLEESAPVTGVGLTSVARALNVLGDLLARREVNKIAEFMERTRRWREEQK
jgi:prephenate dehydrogenase